MSEDEIQIGDYARPEIRIKPGVCTRCGAPILDIGNLCVHCISIAWREEKLAGLGEILRAHPGLKLELARDKGMQRHVALPGFPAMAFCGTRLTTPRKQRIKVDHERLPADTCPACVELIGQARRGETPHA